MTAVLLLLVQADGYPSAWAAGQTSAFLPLSHSLSSFPFPSEIAAVQTLHRGTGPLILHIQTAHGHYETQKKIQSILEYAHQQFGINLFLLEGSTTQLETRYLDFFPGQPEINHELLDVLARHSLAKAPELFLAEMPRARAFGIENPDSYIKNTRLFAEVLEHPEIVDSFLSSFDRQLYRLKEKIPDGTLKAWLKQEENWQREKISFEVRLTHLEANARTNLRVDLQDPAHQLDWPMLYRFFQLRRIEKRWDAQKFDHEKTRLLKKLKSLLPAELYSSLSDFLNGAKGLNLMERSLPVELLMEELFSHLRPSFSVSDYVHVQDYMVYQTLKDELDAGELNQEMQSLSRKIALQLAENKEQKEFVRWMEARELLNALLRLEMTPSQFESLNRAIAELRPSKLASQMMVPGEEAKAWREAEKIVETAYAFYKGTQERDQDMIRNIKTRMQMTGEQQAVVITGGFHTPALEKAFSAEDYRYISVSPTLSQVPDSSSYIETLLKHLKKDKPFSQETLEDIFYLTTPPEVLLDLERDPVQVAASVREALVPALAQIFKTSETGPIQDELAKSGFFQAHARSESRFQETEPQRQKFMTPVEELRQIMQGRNIPATVRGRIEMLYSLAADQSIILNPEQINLLDELHQLNQYEDKKEISVLFLQFMPTGVSRAFEEFIYDELIRASPEIMNARSESREYAWLSLEENEQGHQNAIPLAYFYVDLFMQLAAKGVRYEDLTGGREIGLEVRENYLVAKPSVIEEKPILGFNVLLKLNQQPAKDALLSAPLIQLQAVPAEQAARYANNPEFYPFVWDDEYPVLLEVAMNDNRSDLENFSAVYIGGFSGESKFLKLEILQRTPGEDRPRAFPVKDYVFELEKKPSLFLPGTDSGTVISSETLKRVITQADKESIILRASFVDDPRLQRSESRDQTGTGEPLLERAELRRDEIERVLRRYQERSIDVSEDAKFGPYFLPTNERGYVLPQLQKDLQTLSGAVVGTSLEQVFLLAVQTAKPEDIWIFDLNPYVTQLVAPFLMALGVIAETPEEFQYFIESANSEVIRAFASDYVLPFMETPEREKILETWSNPGGHFPALLLNKLLSLLEVEAKERVESGTKGALGWILNKEHYDKWRDLILNHHVASLTADWNDPNAWQQLGERLKEEGREVSVLYASHIPQFTDIGLPDEGYYEHMKMAADLPHTSDALYVWAPLANTRIEWEKLDDTIPPNHDFNRSESRENFQVERLEDALRIPDLILNHFPVEHVDEYVYMESLLKLLYGGTIVLHREMKGLHHERVWLERRVEDFPGLLNLSKDGFHQGRDQSLSTGQLRRVRNWIGAAKRKLENYGFRTDREVKLFGKTKISGDVLGNDPDFQNPFLHTFIGGKKEGPASRLEQAWTAGKFSDEKDKAYLMHYDNIFRPQMTAIGGVENPFAIRVQHNRDLGGPYKGGDRSVFAYMVNTDDEFMERFNALVEAGFNLAELRYFFRKWVTEEVYALAFGMTIKATVSGLPYGGAKGAQLFADVYPAGDGKFIIRDNFNDEETSLALRSAFSRNFVRHLVNSKVIGAQIDVPAADAGKRQQDVDRMADEVVRIAYEKAKRNKGVFDQWDPQLKKDMGAIAFYSYQSISEPSYLEVAVSFLRKLREEGKPLPFWAVPLAEAVATITSKRAGVDHAGDHGGSIFRAEATGYGGIHVLREVLLREGFLGKGEMELSGLSGKIQGGLGGVGQTASLEFIRNGGMMEALSEIIQVKGESKVVVAYKKGGFSEKDIFAMLDLKSRTGSIADLEKVVTGASLILSNAETFLMSYPADVFILAAKENAINQKNVHSVRAEFILELANGPVTNDAYHEIVNRGMTIIPDSLANAGGVIVSYFEWLQNLNNERWTQAEVKEKLENQLALSVEKINFIRREINVDWRTAADIHMIREVLAAHKQKLNGNDARARSESREIDEKLREANVPEAYFDWRNRNAHVRFVWKDETGQEKFYDGRIESVSKGIHGRLLLWLKGFVPYISLDSILWEKTHELIHGLHPADEPANFRMIRIARDEQEIQSINESFASEADKRADTMEKAMFGRFRMGYVAQILKALPPEELPLSFTSDLTGANVMVIGPSRHPHQIIKLLRHYPRIHSVHMVDIKEDILIELQNALRVFLSDPNNKHLRKIQFRFYFTSILDSRLVSAVKQEFPKGIHFLFDSYVFADGWFSEGQMAQAGHVMEDLLSAGGIHMSAYTHIFPSEGYNGSHKMSFIPSHRLYQWNSALQHMPDFNLFYRNNGQIPSAVKVRSESRDDDQEVVLDSVARRIFHEVRGQTLSPRFDGLPIEKRKALLEILLGRTVYSEKAGVMVSIPSSAINAAFKNQTVTYTDAFMKDMETSAKAGGIAVLSAEWMKAIAQSPRAIYLLLDVLERSTPQMEGPLVLSVGDESIYQLISAALMQKGTGAMQLNWNEKIYAQSHLLPRLKKLIKVISSEEASEFLAAYEYGAAMLSADSISRELPVEGSVFVLEPQSVHVRDLESVVLMLPTLLKAARLVRGVLLKDARIQLLKENRQHLFPYAVFQNQSFALAFADFIAAEIHNLKVVEYSA